MDYQSTKQKIMSLLFILAFGYTAGAMAQPLHEANTFEEVNEASPAQSPRPLNERLSVTHADSWHVIKNQLLCNDDLAKEVRHFLMNIDDAIFQYLHYNSHEKKYATHIGRFNHHLATLKCIIERHHNHPGCANAMHILKQMQKTLADLIKHVTKAQGSKGGLLAAISLGKDVEPLIKNFKNFFPSLMLTVDDQIKLHYKITKVDAAVLLGHIQKRLELK